MILINFPLSHYKLVFLEYSMKWIYLKVPIFGLHGGRFTSLKASVF